MMVPVGDFVVVVLNVFALAWNLHGLLNAFGRGERRTFWAVMVVLMLVCIVLNLSGLRVSGGAG